MKKTFTDLITLQEKLLDNSLIQHAVVKEGTTNFANFKESNSSTYFSAQIFLVENRITDEEFARKLASEIIVIYPEIKNKNIFQITLIYGYDVGIWSSWNRFNYKFDPIKLIAI